jgi:hypothetical protein
MLDLTFLVLAVGNMLPEALHTATQWRDRALTILVGTFRGVPEEEEALLLVTQSALRCRLVVGRWRSK